MNETDKKKELRHDRHTVSLLTDDLVITPKYRVKILTGKVAFVAETGHQAVITDLSGRVGMLLKNISLQRIVRKLYRQKTLTSPVPFK